MWEALISHKKQSLFYGQTIFVLKYVKFSSELHVRFFARDGPHLMALYSHYNMVFKLHDIVCYN